MMITFKKLVLWSVFNRSFYFSGVLFDIQRKLYRHETKWSVKKPVPEPYHDVPSGCREWWCQMFVSAFPGEELPAHS